MEQKDLVAKIYSVHEELRRKKREIHNQEEWDLIWKDHTQNFNCLQEYAQAMQILATEIWEPRNTGETSSKLSDSEINFKCRLDWVHAKSKEYFKDKSVKIKLLDVGSCYNPFKKFQDFFDITAIDLCPAPGVVNEVYQCDFLNLKVSDKSEMVSNSDKTNKLIALEKETFDVVVFSFFLEYLPDKKQRLESCRKARDLLKAGGLLFILRPDSSSVTPTGNCRLIKALKVGNAILGLKRIYFEKLPHLWCMGFEKLMDKNRDMLISSGRYLKDLQVVENSMNIKVDENSLAELFSISQDFKSFESEKHVQSSNETVPVLPELFNELPEFDFDL